jgi:hypothetical protein
MKVSLYQIQNEYLQIVDTLIENGGEETPELKELIEINKEQLQTKGVCYGFIVKQLEANNDMIDAEIERLTKIRKSNSNAIDRLKTNLSTAMQIFEVEKLETPLIKISFRNSESVEITNESMIADKFKTIKTVESFDKKLIKEAIQKGEFVEGATINYNKNILIK